MYPTIHRVGITTVFICASSNKHVVCFRGGCEKLRIASWRDKIVTNCIKSIVTHTKAISRVPGRSVRTYAIEAWPTNGPVTSNSGRTTIARGATMRVRISVIPNAQFDQKLPVLRRRNNI